MQTRDVHNEWLVSGFRRQTTNDRNGVGFRLSGFSDQLWKTDIRVPDPMAAIHWLDRSTHNRTFDTSKTCHG